MQLFKFGLCSFLILLSWSSIAQNHYNIRLNPLESGNVRVNCYEIQLASADAVPLNLAGQNYRLYYDATKLKIQEKTSISLLPKEKYTALIIKDNLVNINAQGAGNLAFDNHLSFVNLGNDLRDELEGGITLPSSGDWVSTANVCFDVLNGSQSNSSSNKNSLFWARPELTNTYATAYVEIAEWVAPSTEVPAKAAIYFDEEASTANINQQWEVEPVAYPNPVSSELTVAYDGSEKLLLQLYTIHGKLVLNNQLAQGASKKGIKIGHLAAGTYQLRISNGEDILVKKIEVIH